MGGVLSASTSRELASTRAASEAQSGEFNLTRKLSIRDHSSVGRLDPTSTYKGKKT